MWQRLTTGWTLIRGAYLLMGIFVIVQSLQEKFWAGIVFGAYFSSMGLFTFGCAARNCTIPKQKYNPQNVEKTEFEEVK